MAGVVISSMLSVPKEMLQSQSKAKVRLQLGIPERCDFGPADDICSIFHPIETSSSEHAGLG